MNFVKYKRNIYPFVALIAAVFIVVFSMIEAYSVNCSYYLIGVYVWLIMFGCYKGCLRVLPVYIVAAGIFVLIYYFGMNNVPAAIAMATRLGGIFLAVALGMSIDSVAITRNMAQLHISRGLTLGMLIATSFVPVLKTEIHRVREAMKTRGAGSVLNPKIFYRAFLVPLCMRLVGISDTLALSVETRGFQLGKTKYTVYKKEVFALWDILFLAGLAAGAALAVIL